MSGDMLLLLLLLLMMTMMMMMMMMMMLMAGNLKNLVILKADQNQLLNVPATIAQ